MSPVVISAIIAFAAAAVFIILGVLALRIHKLWLRLPAVVLSLLFALICLAVGGLALRGQTVLAAEASNPVPEIKINSTPELVARGEKIAHSCAFCHSPDGNLPLSGGNASFFGEGTPMGVLYAPNLTPGGSIKDWSDGQILRAIREGVDDGNLPLIIMPSENYHGMSDADAQAVVAYLRSQPAVQNDTPERDLGWMADVFIGGGMFPTSQQAPIQSEVGSPPAGPTAEYGKYLVTMYACSGCHGVHLAGKAPGQGPAGPNLTALMPTMKQEMFIQQIRTTRKDAKGMPYEQISAATSDEDLAAIYLYLHGLTPLPTNQ